MEHTQKTIAIGAIFLLAGIAIGWGIWGNTARPMQTMHQMPDGSMMDNKMSSPMTSRQMMDMMSMKLDGKMGNEFDAAFLEEMIPHHIGAIKMAQLALTNSKRPEILQMAKDIISAQEKEIDTMRDWQKTWFGIQAQ